MADKRPVKPVKNRATQFCATAVIEEINGEWLILGATDHRFLKGVKIVGGTNQNALWENVQQTRNREVAEESGLTLVSSMLCFDIEKGSVSDPHHQYFYLALSWEGNFPRNQVKQVKEADGSELTVKWWNFLDFSEALAPSHRDGFMAILIVMAKRNPKFNEFLKGLSRTDSSFYSKNQSAIDKL